MDGIPPIDPVDPNSTDAAAGPVFTGGRTAINRWTPRWGGRVSTLDVVAFAIVALVLVVIAALIIL
jgi:hypothetical protein